jgi:hypothetical protein
MGRGSGPEGGQPLAGAGHLGTVDLAVLPVTEVALVETPRVGSPPGLLLERGEEGQAPHVGNRRHHAGRAGLHHLEQGLPRLLHVARLEGRPGERVADLDRVPVHLHPVDGRESGGLLQGPARRLVVAPGERDLAREVQASRLGELRRDRREERLHLGQALLRLGLLPEAGQADGLHRVPLGEELRLLDLLAQDPLALGERLAVVSELRLEPRPEEPRPHPLLGAAPGLRTLGGQPERFSEVAVVEAGHRERRAALPAQARVVRGQEPLRRRLGLRPLVPEGVGHEAAGLDLHHVVGMERRRLVEGGERLVGPALRQLEEGDVLVARGAVRVLGRVLGEGLARPLRVPGRDVGLGQAHVAAGEGHAVTAQLLEVHERLGVALQLDEELGEVVPGRGVTGGVVHRLLVGGDRLLDRRGVERVGPPLDVEPLAGREVRGLRHRLRGVGPRLVDVALVGVDDRQLREGHREAGVGLHRLLEVGLRLLLLEPVVQSAPLGVGLEGL